MVRQPPRRHLVLHGNKAGCGVRNPRFRTTMPDEVTCLGCHRSIQMHDAQVLAQPSKSNPQVQSD